MQGKKYVIVNTTMQSTGAVNFASVNYHNKIHAFAKMKKRGRGTIICLAYRDERSARDVLVQLRSY